MPQASKQNIEKQHGRALLDFLGIKCTLESGDPPAPDLWFRDEGRNIGVEHTRLFAEHGSAQGTLQERRELVEKITNATRLEYQKRGLPPVEVKLYISRCHIKKAGIKALSDQIVDVVTSNLPNNPGTITIDNIGEGRLPAVIDSITMSRLPEHPASFFAPRFAWIVTIDEADLQQTIDGKAEHLQGYLTECDEVWLLMVEEGSDPSNTLEMPDEMREHVYDFRGFARLFVLRSTNERIIELLG